MFQAETQYCKSATNTLWRQFAQAQVARGVIRVNPIDNKSSLEELIGIFLTAPLSISNNQNFSKTQTSS